jgi:lipopolysaccharide/colanic/teichoic acid biosynthesis glycosyltransferase
MGGLAVQRTSPAMFSHHPFTLHGRYSLDVSHALPTWKRVLDLGCCFIGIPLLGFVTFLTGIAALISSTGPIIFSQERLGASGRRFGMYRFRTMRAMFSPIAIGVDPRARLAATSESSRLMPGGGLLRATGLVDLPQLVNVLRGEMSIVGPRPDAFSVSAASAGIAHDRPTALPGITGPWRPGVETNATASDARNWERNYAETRTLGGDLAIIARSLWAMGTLQMSS